MMRSKSIKKIVSHVPPRHVDDFFAVALAKSQFPDAQIEYVHPQRVPESYRTNKEILLLDVGNDYNPEYSNFDHHQSLEIPCSLILIMKLLRYEKLINHPAIRYIDINDRFGPKKAVERFNPL